MPTAAEMQAGTASGVQGWSATSPQPPTSRESTTYSGQPAQSSSWRSEGPYSAPKQTGLGSDALRSNVNETTPGAFLLGVSTLNLAYDLLWSGMFALAAIQEQADPDAIVGFAIFGVWALAAMVCHAMSLVAGYETDRQYDCVRIHRDPKCHPDHSIRRTKRVRNRIQDSHARRKFKWCITDWKSKR